MQERFEKVNEFMAAGFFEEPEASYFIRFSRAVRRYYEKRKMPKYDGGPLYPCGWFASDFDFSYSFSFTCTAVMSGDAVWSRLEKKDKLATEALKRDLLKYEPLVPVEHSVGGRMYTHSHANFRRIVREGLNSYRERIEKMKDADLRTGLIDVWEGMKAFHERSLSLLREDRAENTELYKALCKVPFEPAGTLYEAIVSWNFIYYLDGCDDIGRMDADLIDFYKGEDMTEVFRSFFKNVDANSGWSGSLGPDYNPLTLQCINACKGIRRPSLELRVTPGMPDEVWSAAIDAIKAGGGSPCFYNEEGYQTALAELFPEIPEEDRLRFCGGGCTETMLTGLSNVGSLDAGINLALIFEKYMNDNLRNVKSFDEFYNGYIKLCHEETEKVLNSISESQKLREKYRPQPVRTLLIDDCIEKEKEFNAGGARYRWSVVNLAGLINVMDSMLAIKHLVFDAGVMSGSEMLERLENGENFSVYSSVPKHGTDSDEANAMASRLSDDICSAFEGKVPYSGGKFLPSSIQFTTYAAAGRSVSATPDGRGDGAPLCDSIGAIHGNDKLGVTAMLNSASALCQEKMAGTPVLNVKLNTKESPENVKAIVKGYFQSGGMQMQITCVSAEDMINARKEPEKYPNLIVRIGGYSEYFTRLSPELQQSVIDRTLCGM